MLLAVLNKSWRDHTKNKELYGNLLSITTVIRDRRLKFMGHCWRSKEELISETLFWKPSYGYNSVERPKKNYLDQLLTNVRLDCNHPPNIMEDRTLWKDNYGHNNPSKFNAVVVVVKSMLCYRCQHMNLPK